MHSGLLHFPNTNFYSGSIKAGIKDIDRAI